jgi:hypothetical protein
MTYKKLIILLLTTLSYAQQKDGYIAFSAGFDVKNTLKGSEATNNKPALDGLYQFSMVGFNIEGVVSYEHFQKIGFSKWFFGGGYHFPIYMEVLGEEVRTVFIPTLGIALINRFDRETYNPQSHLSIENSLALRWHLANNIAFETQVSLLPRVDLKYRNEKSITPDDLSKKYLIVVDGLPIVPSVYVKIVWIINNKYK